MLNIVKPELATLDDLLELTSYLKENQRLWIFSVYGGGDSSKILKENIRHAYSDSLTYIINDFDPKFETI